MAVALSVAEDVIDCDDVVDVEAVLLTDDVMDSDAEYVEEMVPLVERDVVSLSDASLVRVALVVMDQLVDRDGDTLRV